MRQTSGTRKSPGEKIVKDIKRATRKHYSSEEKIRIVLDGLRGEDSIAELCRREGISQGIYYKWSKDFMEAGKRRLAGDTARAAKGSSLQQSCRMPSFRVTCMTSWLASAIIETSMKTLRDTARLEHLRSSNATWLADWTVMGR